jgi:hypothetical protein
VLKKGVVFLDEWALFVFSNQYFSYEALIKPEAEFLGCITQ